MRRNATSRRESHRDEYLATVYWANMPDAYVGIRIGRVTAALDSLLRPEAITTWAFLTAYNPRSQMLAPPENERRQKNLVRLLTRRGMRFFEGLGVATDGSWPPEQSCLVIGIDEAQAIVIARHYDQAAFVWGEIGRRARLVMVPYNENGDHPFKRGTIP